eukprot:59524_1
MMPRGFGILLILLLATLPSVLCAALKDETAKTNGPEAAYSTLQYFDEGFVAPINDFVDTPEYGHEGNGSTSSSPKGNGSTSISPKELSSGSSETSTQSGLEDTTFDIVNIESTLDHNKKSTEDIVNIESTLDDNNKSTEDDPQKDRDYWKKKALQLTKEKLEYKKEAVEYKQENHKLRAENAMYSDTRLAAYQDKAWEVHDISGSPDKLNRLTISRGRIPEIVQLDTNETSTLDVGYGGQMAQVIDIHRKYAVYLDCGRKFSAVIRIVCQTSATSGWDEFKVVWSDHPNIQGRFKSQDYLFDTSTKKNEKHAPIELSVWATNEKEKNCIDGCQFSVRCL